MIGVFGGTFNPVHQGHIAIASDVFKCFKLKQVEFIPCFQPVHRQDPLYQSNVTAQQRVQMLEIALTEYPQLRVNSVEVNRQGPSYMIDTLMQLKQDFPDQSLLLMLGTDAYNGLPRWRAPQKILQHCHIVICQRPQENIIEHEYAVNSSINQVIQDQQSFGRICHLEVTQVPVSSSLIRQQLVEKKQDIQYLPSAVLNFIQLNQLYVSH